MSNGNRGNPLLWMLAGIGALALILIVAGLFMHGSMMGGMVGGGGMMGGGFGWLLGLLLVVGIVAVIVMLVRRPG